MKRLTVVIMALLIVLGLSQCKKPAMPTYNGFVGVEKEISFSVGNGDDGAKVNIVTAGNLLKYNWESKDKLHVYASIDNFATGVYCGTLNMQSYDGDKANFNGILENVPEEGGRFRFYYFGGNIDANNAFEVNFVEQDGNLNTLKNKVIAVYEDEVTEIYENKVLTVEYAIARLDLSTGFTGNTLYMCDLEHVGMRINGNGIAEYIKGPFSEMKGVNLRPNDYYVAIIPINEMRPIKISDENRHQGTILKEGGILRNVYYTKNNNGDAVEVVGNLLNENVIKGLFTVGVRKSVHFANGNLQYIGKGKNNNLTPTWRLADNQWDFMAGGPNAEGSQKGNVNLGTEFAHSTINYYNYGSLSHDTDATARKSARDLFSWGCTGFQDVLHNSNQDYYEPFSIKMTKYNPDNIGEKYGPTAGTTAAEQYNLSVANKSDWGYVMGGATSIWRTMSGPEFDYLTTTRNNNAMFRTIDGETPLYLSGFGYLTVNSTTVGGFFFLPDNYYWNSSNPKHYSDKGWNYTVADLAEYNIVFFPFTCNRTREGIWPGNNTSVCPNIVDYWTSSADGNPGQAMQFIVGVTSGRDDFRILPNVPGERWVGRAVRLVTE